MHAETFPCNAMALFPPLFDMAGQSRVTDLAEWPSKGVL